MTTSGKAGFVAIVGVPNVGKSTWLNAAVGQKIAGVSPKPQTTRQVIRGILTDERGQIVFLDTPGIHQPKDKLSHRMALHAQSSLEDADVVLWLVEPALPNQKNKQALEQIKNANKPTILLVNKVDLINKVELLPILETYQSLFQFRDIFPVSALQGINQKEVIELLFELLPQSPPYFPEEQISDQTERFVIAEMIREKVFRSTKQEIPYASAVTIDEFKDRSDQLVYIHATVIVEKDSQKKIIIGAGGEMIKRIGSEARKEIEPFLDRRVFLELKVKVYEKWKDDEKFLDQLEHEGGIE
ncbi:MAG: GTPase Era [Candidatus Omnitrophica bacterium CG11_big_fil_rev_8_21_14_0_20_45_26]|uniref:GTPase Era n=1 Tax=Candidatus Abzuiibacterium crystallinum TaxID=1974748 RepID=A0A2H0LN97_9BACT|nr:MAG: GTPase Era [Candidatus Omnitrophica bacterium CG11_big_fil_rev_8_21_14_0_20_45_26]PIW65506.1 MAG: GTPase Era [Candidatus Omnitrophica bacterium CG12_big_fil_rev_8_21_14_0_65_45_16]